VELTVSLPRDPADSLPNLYDGVTDCLPLTARGRLLIEEVKPFMAGKDTVALAAHLRQVDWSEPALISLLTCTDAAIVRAAAWTLAHVGTMASNLPMAGVLQHDDPAITDLAENALWSIWLRATSTNIHKRLCDAIRLAEQDCCDSAQMEMDAIIRCCPTFAEAYDQRAIVKFLKSDYAGAVADYQQTIALNPVHFGAIASLGHCFAALGRHKDALDAYHRALEVHPRMDGIRTAISQIRQMVGSSCQAGKLPTFWALG
jgi:tetratricopeptide (TPR) repeat protein